jgi:hypothetical protein
MRKYGIFVHNKTEPDVWKRNIGYLRTATATICRHAADSTAVRPGFLLDQEIMILAFDGNYLSGFALASPSFESDELLLVESVTSRSASRGVHRILEIVARAGGYQFLQLHALPHAIIEFGSLGYEAIVGDFSEDVLTCADEYERIIVSNKDPGRTEKLAKLIRDMIVAGFSSKIPEVSFEKKINSLRVSMRKSLKPLYCSDNWNDKKDRARRSSSPPTDSTANGDHEESKNINPMWKMSYNLDHSQSLQVTPPDSLTDSVKIDENQKRKREAKNVFNRKASTPFLTTSEASTPLSITSEASIPFSPTKASIPFSPVPFSHTKASIPFSPTSNSPTFALSGSPTFSPTSKGLFDQQVDYPDRDAQKLETFFDTKGIKESQSGSPFSI